MTIAVKKAEELKLVDFLDQNGLTLFCVQNGKKVWEASIPRLELYDSGYALEWGWVSASEWCGYEDYQDALKKLAEKLSGRKLRWWTSGEWPFRQYKHFDFTNTALTYEVSE